MLAVEAIEFQAFYETERSSIQGVEFLESIVLQTRKQLLPDIVPSTCRVYVSLLKGVRSDGSI